MRQWQNSLTSYRDESGKPCSQTYLKCINNQLTAIFNYAVKYYGYSRLYPNKQVEAARQLDGIMP